MKMMKAVGLKRYLPIEDPESLLDIELPVPAPEGHDLLVEVKAVSVNPVDTKVRAPKDKVETDYRILGYDAAGVVTAVGDQVTLFKPGDEVYYAGSILRPGSNSPYQLVDERIVGAKPQTLDFAEAAALPLTALTAWEGLYDRLGVAVDPEANRGRTLLIIGAAGGVGSIATQLGREAGLTVIGTASRTSSADWAREHGAAHIINHHEEMQPQLEALGYREVDYIFCCNSTAAHWDSMAQAIAPQGKIVSIVEMKEPVNLTLLMNKSATFVWELMFTRSRYQTADLLEQHRALQAIGAQIDAGKLRTTVAQRLSPINAANLREAHRLLESGSTIGKVVLEDFA
ncbi:NADPH:quinone reductase [Paenibacillus sp. 598K]|uniref:zinc-binding alcohol dehydrogenase family protein n=1 Tax=Paenibacillus sp. 598K TaxID=1117987 RepID=UPI000FF97A97|nr:zinc-binding alcohol dehydrogenase family protein [Paenibacillus sp. 598K]GBF74895.1 NADPH:quinone reductase [Paenibacillus sp. 598K]